MKDATEVEGHVAKLGRQQNLPQGGMVQGYAYTVVLP